MVRPQPKVKQTNFVGKLTFGREIRRSAGQRPSRGLPALFREPSFRTRKPKACFGLRSRRGVALVLSRAAGNPFRNSGIFSEGSEWLGAGYQTAIRWDPIDGHPPRPRAPRGAARPWVEFHRNGPAAPTMCLLEFSWFYGMPSKSLKKWCRL